MGDPACDFDADVPSPGGCTFRLWACANVTDPLVPCTPTTLKFVKIRRPPLSRLQDGADYAIVQALLAGFATWDDGAARGLARVGFYPPLGPGTVCTGRLDLVVPVGPARSLAVDGFDATEFRRDSDPLRLRCIP
jgi:hypothetical protein